MRTYIIISVILVSIIGFIGIFLYSLLLGKDHVYLVPQVNTVEKKLTPEEQYLSSVRSATQEKNRQNTLLNEALRRNNDRLCESISDPEIKKVCQNQFIVRKAISSNNPATCQTLSGSDIDSCEDEVYYTLSLSVGDRSLCERVGNIQKKRTCLEKVSVLLLKNMTASGELTDTSCDILVGGAYDSCLVEYKKEKDARMFELATKTDDISLCRDISEEDIRSLCQDTIRLRFALSSGNPLLCKSISDDKKMALCEKEFDKTTLATLYRSIILSGEIDRCSSLSDTKLAHQCHDTLLIKTIRSTKNISKCTELFDTGSLDACKTLYGSSGGSLMNSDTPSS